MADDPKDPREAVLEDWRWELGRREPDPDHPWEVLADLDAADPIRQLWPEVVEALEHMVCNCIACEGLGELREAVQAWDIPGAPVPECGVCREARALLDRARAIIPEEESTDD